MPFEKELEELNRRITRSQALGGPDKVNRHKAKGKWTARERIERLVDPDSFSNWGVSIIPMSRAWKTRPRPIAK